MIDSTNKMCLIRPLESAIAMSHLSRKSSMVLKTARRGQISRITEYLADLQKQKVISLKRDIIHQKQLELDH